MTQQSNRDAWRKFLGISDARNGRADARTGVGVGRSAGRASGAGATDRDGNPEGEAGESAEKGNGALDASKRLKTGDKGDRLEDLYDCETGEKVTIDGLGVDGTEAYPSGFQDCEGGEIEDGYVEGVYWYARTGASNNGVVASDISGSFQTQRRANTFCLSNPNLPADVKSRLSSGVFNGQSSGCTTSDCDGRNYFVQVSKRYCSENPDPVCDLPPPKNNWPAVDKNHLVWNKDKNCFEPLCPELNTQVLDKYKGCEDERILCDADGNKVKVKVDGNVVKVTQEKYGQTAEIKNGKVTAVKKLTESQTEAEFK